MEKRWRVLVLLILGALLVSGCVSNESMMAYNEAMELFQKATVAGAKKCAPCEYASAEAALALAAAASTRTAAATAAAASTRTAAATAAATRAEAGPGV